MWKATQIADNGYHWEGYEDENWPAIDWNSQAAIEYFGPPSQNQHLRQTIIGESSMAFLDLIGILKSEYCTRHSGL